jgi:hypothetical protein
MKSRILLPTILLTLLLTQTGFTQTPPESLNAPSSDYGIEPEGLYPGSAILEILTAAEDEIDAAVTEAYAEGYKAATLRYAPDLAASKAMEAALRAELETERRKNRMFKPALFIIGGLSFAGGFGIHALISK